MRSDPHINTTRLITQGKGWVASKVINPIREMTIEADNSTFIALEGITGSCIEIITSIEVFDSNAKVVSMVNGKVKHGRVGNSTTETLIHA